MAQGSRKRFAMLGAGMLLCTGLVGCMNDNPKPLPLHKGGPPQKTPGLMGSTVKPNQTGTTYNGGVQPVGFNTPATRTPGNTTGFGTGAVGGTNTFGSPTVPGTTGTGASMAPIGVIPQTSPPSNYSPASGGTPMSSLPSNPPTFDYGNVTMPTPPQPPSNAGFPAAPTRQ